MAKFPIEVRATAPLGEVILYVLRFAIKVTLIAALVVGIGWIMLP
jgi:hypothetical protein